MKKLILPIFAMLFTAQVMAKGKDGSEIQKDNLYPKVKMVTSMGDIVVELDRFKAPITVNNFLRYVDKGSYDDTVFHRIIDNFVVQGGGLDLEFQEKPNFGPIFNESGNGLKNDVGTIAMARQNDPHSATRQFFFNLVDNVSLNPGKRWGYTVFGEIVEGQEVLEKLAKVKTGYHVQTGMPDVPVETVVLKSVILLPQTK